MSRARDFSRYEQGFTTDSTYLLNELGETITVLRNIDTDGARVGFTREVNSATQYKNILAYIKPARGGSSAQGFGQNVQVSQVDYIGITQNPDVKIGDIWLQRGRRFFVKSINPSAIGHVEAHLEYQT